MSFVLHNKGDRPRWCAGFLLASILISSGTVFAQQKEKGPRVIVVIQGDYIKSNDILFQYANAMDLDGIDALAVGHPNDMIPFSDLVAKLPDPLSGWIGETPSGMQMTTPGGSYSFASEDYSKDGADDEVSVIIYDTVQNEFGPWYGLW